MVIAIFGESCTGKSTLAKLLKSAFDAEVITGKDYLRFAKHELEALRIFQNKLNDPDSKLIYVISDKQQLKHVPDHAFRILMCADMKLICERFASRMNGKLSDPVRSMLERKHGCFDAEKYHLKIDDSIYDVQHLIEIIEKSI